MEHSCTQEKDEYVSGVENSQKCVDEKTGGWITFPFIIGSMMGLTLAATGWYANIVVFAIQKYNIKTIAAAQVSSFVGGGVNFFPILGAILADSVFGSYSVVLASSLVSLLGAIMFILASAIPSLRPPPCANPHSTICKPPSSLQYAYLYATLAISMIGFGGIRFVLGALGADQFRNPRQQRVFFNWFIFSIEASSVVGFTALLYLQDKGRWTLSFGISAAINAIAIALFLLGSRNYRLEKRQGSPFVSIARVLVASFRKCTNSKAGLEVPENDCYFYGTPESKTLYGAPSRSLRFFNRAALIGGDEQSKSTLVKSWRLCTVEEVEDLKKLIKALPIWSGGILLSTIAGGAASFAVLQSLVMDRSIGSHFKVPAASIIVFPLLSGSLMLAVLDRIIYPLWNSTTGRSLPLLRRVGVGHFLTVASMICFALIEKKRLNLAHSLHMISMNQHAIVPMSVLWLILPLGLMGMASSFYYPAEVAFFYEELPRSLRSTAAALASLHFAVGYYLSTAFISLIQRTTLWLPDDINHGRMDKVYWALGIVGAVNCGYYITCAKFYKSRKYEYSEDISVPKL